ITKSPGLYFLFFTGQIGAAAPGFSGFIDCWFVKNSKPVANSTKRQTIDTSNYAGLMNTGLVVPLAPGDPIGVMFLASGPSLGLIQIRPSVAPLVSSVNFIIFKID